MYTLNVDGSMKGGDSMKTLHMVAFTLVVVGALNWGLVALFNLNLVEALLGSVPELAKVVYILVGVSAVVLMFTHMQDCKACASKGK